MPFHAGAPELYKAAPEIKANLFFSFQPPLHYVVPALEESYAGIIAGMRYAVNNSAPTTATIPFPQPGYAVEFLCDNLAKFGASCERTCADVPGQVLIVGTSTEVPVSQMHSFLPPSCGQYWNSATSSFVTLDSTMVLSSMCPDQCSTSGSTSSQAESIEQTVLLLCTNFVEVVLGRR